MTTTTIGEIENVETIDLTVTFTMVEPTAPTEPQKPADLVLPAKPKLPTFPTLRVISYSKGKKGKKAQVTAQVDGKWQTFHCWHRTGTTYRTESGLLFDLQGLTTGGPSNAQLRNDFHRIYRDWQADCERLSSAHKHALTCYIDDMSTYRQALVEYRRELAAYNAAKAENDAPTTA